jgi:hypothetical protein
MAKALLGDVPSHMTGCRMGDEPNDSSPILSEAAILSHESEGAADGLLQPAPGATLVDGTRSQALSFGRACASKLPALAG